MKKIIFSAIASLASCTSTKTIQADGTNFSYNNKLTIVSLVDGFGFERKSLDTTSGTVIVYKNNLKIKNMRYKITKQTATEIYAYSLNTTVHLWR